YNAVTEALKNGQLTPAQLDQNVTRVLELVMKSPTFKGYKFSSQPALKANAAVARQAAAEGMILLRNQGAALPLGAGRKGLGQAGFVANPALSQLYAQYVKAEKAKITKPKGLLDPAPVIAEMPVAADQLQPAVQAADVAIVLSGKVNPSGKLATTFPVSYADVPFSGNFPGKLLDASTKGGGLMGAPSENTYEEGIYVGYRYYNTFKVKPAYEFGYGLSYTTFKYGPLTV
nr:putative beta-glucosidase M [Tanacetum cinerariifolium]